MVVLLLPAATTYSGGGEWDANPRLLVVESAAFVALLWLAAGPRWFFALTYPIALASVLVVGADLLRGADLVQLVMVTGDLDAREVYHAVAPYWMPILIAAVTLAAAAAFAIRRPVAPARPRVRFAGIALLCVAAIAMALAAPVTLLRAWPINIVSVKTAVALGRADFITAALPLAPFNPRVPTASWGATRAEAAQGRETYVIVIGESVRADRLAACGGKRQLALRHPSIVYCNVTSGSSSTHTSVPLLVSRDLPGQPLRVTADATVLHAFQETGFRTYWLGLQGPTVAWPDADVARYATATSTTQRDLLPLVLPALAEAAPKKALILHTYDAHFPFCSRYDPRNAPFAVDCRSLGPLPTRATRDAWLASYDNAIADGLAFVDAVIAQLEAEGGEAFLVYTSDHGENLLDDDRNLINHALGEVTRFDTRVPMIFWASAAWRERHPQQAEALAAHRGVAAMHADLVPTILGAAGVRYVDRRKDVVDLTRAAPAQRTRWVAARLGQAVDGDRLR